MPTPSAGAPLRSLTALPTLLSTILPTSALLTDGFDESCTAAHTRPPTAITPTTPRISQDRRRQRGGRGGGLPSPSEPADPSDPTPPTAAVGMAPYLIDSTYCRFLGKRPRAWLEPVGIVVVET